MYWLLIGLGLLLFILMEIEFYSVTPPELTIIQKLSICFAYFLILLILGASSNILDMKATYFFLVAP